MQIVKTVYFCNIHLKGIWECHSILKPRFIFSSPFQPLMPRHMKRVHI